MNVTREKGFDKNFKKRIAPHPKLVALFNTRLKMLLAGHTGSPINNHHLGKSMAGYRSFSLAGDLRVIYWMKDGEMVLVDIGSHNQVYGE
jgi:mRNA-degrading endonuclease YafQ of YafQ-DinJ toxin-antitoxin module